MRRFIYLILTVIIFNLFVQLKDGQTSPKPHISASNAVLLEANSKRVLYEKESDKQVPIASITKVMTAIVAIEYGQLDDVVSVSERAIQTEGSSIYLKKGEKMTLEDLLYGLMLRSGNDAANAIAEHIGGSIEGFVHLMNEKAAYIGMTRTNFMNPHGLDDENHYSTAYDIAILMSYAMENDIFQTVSSTKSYMSSNRTYAWHNKNKLLTSLYEYCNGGKTGFTRRAGRTLVTTAQKNEMDLIAVTLNAPDDWNDHIALYEWGYLTYELIQLERERKQTYVIANEKMSGYIENDFFYPLTESERKQIRKKVRLYRNIKDDHDREIGTITFEINDEEVIKRIYKRKRSNHFLNVYKNMLFDMIGWKHDG